MSWTTEPFKRFAEYLKEAGELTRLTRAGVGILKHAPDLLSTLLGALDGDWQDAAKKAAEFAAREAREGFPALHARTLVEVWTCEESNSPWRAS
jgi:hypothetical protein